MQSLVIKPILSLIFLTTLFPQNLLAEQILVKQIANPKLATKADQIIPKFDAEKRMTASQVETAVAEGGSHGGGGNAVVEANDMFLDRYEAQNTRYLKWPDVLKSVPGFAKRVAIANKTIVGLEEVLESSHATNKRWVFSKIPLSLSNTACINASVYAVNRKIVACQNDEFVRVDDVWFSSTTRKEAEEDRIWLLSHELLVGLNQIATYYYKDEEKIRTKIEFETKLRIVNAAILSLDKKGNLSRWDAELQPQDFYRVTGKKVYTQADLSEAISSMTKNFSLICNLVTSWTDQDIKYITFREYFDSIDRVTNEIRAKYGEQLKNKVITSEQYSKLFDEAFAPYKVWYDNFKIAEKKEVEARKMFNQCEKMKFGSGDSIAIKLDKIYAAPIGNILNKIEEGGLVSSNYSLGRDDETPNLKLLLTLYNDLKSTPFRCQ